MDRRISRHLVLDALTMALEYRCPEGPLVLHSDRGAQYQFCDLGCNLLVTLDRKIGTDTPDRIYINGDLLPLEYEPAWAVEFNKIIDTTNFQYQDEGSLINELLMAITSRGQS